MESVFRFLSRFFREKRGSSTMEYVVILAVGALFAALLFHALQGDEVRSAIQTAVENAILGKTIDAPGKDTKISHEGNRDLSDVPSPTEIPESLVDSNNPSGSNDSLKNQRDQSPIPNGFTLFGNLFYGIGVLPDTTDDPWKGLADITGLDIFASKWSTEDWLICAQGVWECLNKEDIKRDRRDLANDPKGYISDVLGLDEWKRRWEGIKRIDLTGQWRDFTDDPGGYFDRKWNFTKERMGSWWADISRTPGNYAKDLLLDAIGWYDVQAWWTGRDPQTGERLRVENRKARLLFAFPLPYTKGAKYTKKGIDLVGDFADFTIDLACAKKRGKGGCDDVSEGWVMSRNGSRINGRWYTIHALERMAPDIPEVREELKRRGRDSIDPRGVPPMVVEHTIQTGIRVKNRERLGTWLHFGEDIIAITNDNGDVVTIYPLSKKELKRLLNRGDISEEEYKMVLKERDIK